MNTVVILLICGTIALHSCKSYDGVNPVDAEEEDEEESMSSEIVRQMYESVPWSALSNKSVREALHTLNEFVTSREARALVRSFVLDVWSEREEEDGVDFLSSFLHFLDTVSAEPKVWQATRRILTFLQSSLQENYGSDLAQPPQQYDEDFLENFLEQNDIFNKEDQYKDDYAEQVNERKGILKPHDIQKILQGKTGNENLVEEDAHAVNTIRTARTDTSPSTKPADNLLLNKTMNHSPEVNKTDKSSNMEIIIKLKDKPHEQINVEVKQEEPVTMQTNVHAKHKGTKRNIVGERVKVRVRHAKDKSKDKNVRGASLPVQAVRRKEEDMAVTPPPSCPPVTEMVSSGKISDPVPDKRHSVDRQPCGTQELKLQDCEKVAFLSLIRAIILKEKYNLCPNTPDKISQSTLPPSPRETWESNTTQVTDKGNITLSHLRREYSSDVIPNDASVSPLPDTQSVDQDKPNTSMPTEVTSIHPDPLKVNNTHYINFFSKLLHQISNDSITPSHDEITTGGTNQPLTPPSQSNSTEHSTSTPSVDRETVLSTKVPDWTPHVTSQFKDNLQDFFYGLKNLPVEPFKNREEETGPQPSNIAAENLNHEDDISWMDSPGPFIGNIEQFFSTELRTKQGSKSQGTITGNNSYIPFHYRSQM